MKKFISFLLIFTMLFTLVATLNVTAVSAASVNTFNFQYFNSANKCLYTSFDGTTYGGKYFQISSTDNLKNVTYYENMQDVSDEPFLNIISKKYIWNNNEKVNFAKPVMNINFKMYIPSADLNSVRSLYLQLAKKSGNSYANNAYGTVYFTLTNTEGKVYGGASTNSSNVARIGGKPVSGDEWHQMSMRIFTNKAGEIAFAMYMDGIMYVLCKSNATDIKFDDIGIRQLYFETEKNTYIKDLKVDFEDFDPTFVPDKNATYYNSVVFNKCDIDSTSNAVKVSSSGTVSTILQTSSQSTAPYKSGSVYKNVNYTVEDGSLKVTLNPSATSSGTHATIQNFMQDLTSYFPEGSTKYMHISYDVKNPTGSESASKEQIWRFGNDLNSKTSSVYTIGSRMKGNVITLFNENVFDGDETTKKSVEYNASSDKWYRIISLLKITNTNDGYVIHADGYVMDIEADTISKIYESDEIIPKNNGLVLSQQRTDIVTAKDTNQKPVITYYDNIMTRIWDTDFSTYYKNITNELPADEVYDFGIELNWVNDVAVAKARNVSGITSQKLLLAAYNTNKQLVSVMVSTNNDIVDINKGIVELNMNTNNFNDVKGLKAFFFDSLINCKPIKDVVSIIQK